MPAPPDGQVTVTARLRISETGPLQQAGLPAGQVRRIAVAEIAADLPYPVLLDQAGYRLYAVEP